MRIEPTYQEVFQFLEDEKLLNNTKTKNVDSFDHWSININDPFIADSRSTFGISIKVFKDGNRKVIYNGWRSKVYLGDDYSGQFYKFVKIYKDFNHIEEAYQWFFSNYIIRSGGDLLERFKQKDETTTQNIVIPDFRSHFERLNLDNESHQEYIQYMLNRKVSIEKIKQLKIFVDKEDKRLVFPVYENHELVFFARRAINKHILPWIKGESENVNPIWNLENINGEVIYIFEGIFDAILLPNGVALFGVAFNDDMKKKIINKKYSKIVVVMDNDEAGFNTKIRIANELQQEGQNVFIYNYYGIPKEYKDFSLMAKHGIPFNLEERVIPYNFITKLQIQLKKVS